MLTSDTAVDWSSTLICSVLKSVLDRGGTKVPPKCLSSPEPYSWTHGGGGRGCRSETCARTYQTTPIASFLKVIDSPTDRPTPITDQIRAIEGSSPPTIAPPKMAHDEAVEVPRRKTC